MTVRSGGRPADGDAAAAPLAIVAALTAELAGVLVAASSVRRWRLPPASQPGDGQRFPRLAGARGAWTPRRRVHRLRAWRGRLGGREVVMAATGDGAAAAAAGLAALLAEIRPHRLLVLGVAGGLTPGLRSGSLVAARQVVADEGQAAALQPPDAAWLAQAVAAGAEAGTVVSTRRILGGAAAKRAALARTVPPPLAATVDLESASYAAVAAAGQVPYLVVRAVLDPVEEALPLDFEACRLSGGGGVSNARVVLRALARPRSFAALWRLRGRVRAAAGSLAAMALRLVAAEPAGLPGPCSLPPGELAPSADDRNEQRRSGAAGGR
jgi:adenosylhomocysteine nucleosidase